MSLDLVSPLGLDPRTHDVVRAELIPAIPKSRVLLLDNGKWNVNHLFSAIQKGLAPHVSELIRVKKPHYSKVMRWSDLEPISGRFDWVITGAAD